MNDSKNSKQYSLALSYQDAIEKYIGLSGFMLLTLTAIIIVITDFYLIDFEETLLFSGSMVVGFIQAMITYKKMLQNPEIYADLEKARRDVEASNFSDFFQKSWHYLKLQFRTYGILQPFLFYYIPVLIIFLLLVYLDRVFWFLLIISGFCVGNYLSWKYKFRKKIIKMNYKA
jgi:hypothetical protein